MDAGQCAAVPLDRVGASPEEQLAGSAHLDCEPVAGREPGACQGADRQRHLVLGADGRLAAASVLASALHA
jgi:hypothetical protein